MHSLVPTILMISLKNSTCKLLEQLKMIKLNIVKSIGLFAFDY